MIRNTGRLFLNLIKKITFETNVFNYCCLYYCFLFFNNYLCSCNRFCLSAESSWDWWFALRSLIYLFNLYFSYVYSIGESNVFTELPIMRGGKSPSKDLAFFCYGFCYYNFLTYVFFSSSELNDNWLCLIAYCNYLSSCYFAFCSNARDNAIAY